jgi:hypothetical protein
LKKKKQIDPSTPKEEIYSEEWEIGKGMGILPNDIPFTQNIGCVGGKTKTSKSKNSNPNKDGDS